MVASHPQQDEEEVDEDDKEDDDEEVEDEEMMRMMISNDEDDEEVEEEDDDGEGDEDDDKEDEEVEEEDDDGESDEDDDKEDDEENENDEQESSKIDNMLRSLVSLFERCIVDAVVETIELESRDKVRGFAESLWESDKNIEVVLLENGLAKLRNTFVFTRVATYNDLVRAQEIAKTKKLNKFWTMVDFMSNVEDQTGLVQLCSLVYITIPSSMEADKFLSEQILKKELSATIVLLDSEGEMINCDELGGDEEVEEEDDDGESDEDYEEEDDDDDDKEGDEDDEENENDELE
ncbi:hypothetical protein D8674_012522 [Pyrus ussuriensis x Pyrus communis]|uniref:Uncharacterized protein n=1 Tax=Pyrus ussuriensis x Pyrus communis TaxID=2448454 RepID=A0A5N5GF66_9ROSA|nr:hypothetical protein D8674_012522 [Pyrus ussuriensis x Pyrus communis]